MQGFKIQHWRRVLGVFIKQIMATLVQSMPPFDPDADVGASVGPRWRIWLDDFETFVVANAITDDTRKRALLLFQAGPRVREIFRQLPNTGEAKDYKKAVEKLTEYFEPQKNKLYEVYKFRQATQQSKETIDQFHTRLRSLAQSCEFTAEDMDFQIMLQIVIGGSSTRLRKMALRDPKLTLNDLLLEGRRAEMSAYQAAEMEKKTDDVQAVKVPERRNKTRPRKQNCRSCGGKFPHKNKPCPAQGQTCHKCGKSNHFAKYCFSSNMSETVKTQKPKVRPIHQEGENSDSSDSNYCYAVNSTKQKQPEAYVTIKGNKCHVLVDTGTTINIIDNEAFKRMNGVELKKTKVKAYAYNSKTPMRMQGKFDALIETKKRFAVATFYVTEDNGGCLLSSSTAQDLGLISFHINKVDNKESPVKDKGIASILNNFPMVFKNLGKLKGKQVELVIDSEVKPIAQQQRRIPFHLRKQVEVELDKLVAQDIIERVPENEKTDWVSPIVCVPKKNGEIRLCVDMRAANNAIKRVRHPIPTVKDVSIDLNGATVFSKLDLTQAYHQLELAPKSRHITTFTTHMGLFRYKRLNYGTNSAAEIFQHMLQTSLQGLQGVRNIADDVIIFGKDMNEHNQALEACLKRMSENNLTLNLEKCKFLKKNLDFFGFQFSKDGKRPDPKKIDAFANTPTPTNASEVRSLLGMSNYCSQFIPDYATITAPLRELTKKNTPFQWSEACQEAYDKLKAVLTSSPVVSYFDVNKESIVLVDASPVGLSAILAQRAPQSEETKIIAYASRSLTDVETRYSQTEKEALAIVWGIEHFHIYLYGAPFILYTDHKPLEVIYANPCSKPPARIERWMLRLQQYDFSVVYKKGAENPADFMSRHPLPIKHSRPNIADEYVNFIAQEALFPALTIEEIRSAVENDKQLRAVRAAIKTNLWSSDLVKPFRRIGEEITIDHKNQILLRGTRIIIPQALQSRVIKLAHVGHQGLAKTKALLREYVWFPEIEKLVKEEIDTCIACQATGQPNPQEPLQPTPLPEGPWKELKVDFYGPLPQDQYLLVVIDTYSRYPEVEHVTTTSARATIPKLDAIFARHGIPDEVKSDNGPPFFGDEFTSYMKSLGIKHMTSTPLWPQGNATAEAFMKPLGKAICTAVLENRKWKQELYRFLLNYRTTPHATTKVPPAQLLFNRIVKGRLPLLPTKSCPVDRHNEARFNDEQSKKKSKDYADTKRRVNESEIKVGDTVIVHQLRPLFWVSTLIFPKQTKLMLNDASSITVMKKL